jgi:hypothetical protein
MEYRTALLRAVEEWNSKSINDEWLFEKFRDQTIGSMSASDAFLAIDETVEFLLREPDESTATEILQTIIGLARKSETTEFPVALLVNKQEIENKFSKFGVYAREKLIELYRYYRV